MPVNLENFPRRTIVAEVLPSRKMIITVASPGPQGPPGPTNPGTPGASAYEVAVAAGFSGTVDEWLASLDGEPGNRGASAYEVALVNGFVGTIDEWLASLDGEPGDPGLSAYEIAVANGFVGNEAEWLNSLDGEPGNPGASAYQIAVEEGFVGTEAEWLASLEGAPATTETIAAYLDSVSGEPNGIPRLDASRNVVQNKKISGGGLPSVIRDSAGTEAGKVAVQAASIASDDPAAIILETGVWRDTWNYAFRLVATTALGYIDVVAFRCNGVVGHVNNGSIPVIATQCVSQASGYFAIALQPVAPATSWGSSQFVCHEVMAAGGAGVPGVGDSQVNTNTFYAQADLTGFNQQTLMPVKTWTSP